MLQFPAISAAYCWCWVSGKWKLVDTNIFWWVHFYYNFCSIFNLYTASHWFIWTKFICWLVCVFSCLAEFMYSGTSKIWFLLLHTRCSFPWNQLFFNSNILAIYQKIIHIFHVKLKMKMNHIILFQIQCMINDFS